ncbi:MAG: polyprenyl synthetase family protein [Promethearchaeota archaeon]
MIDEFLKKESKLVNIELEKFFKELNKTEKEILFADFNNQLREFITPKDSKAKRLHPILLIAAFNGIINPLYLEEQIDEIRKVSIAVELLHSGHLIHDDLIDNDDTRRGKPTFHVQLRNEIRKTYKSIDLPEKDELIQLYGRDMSVLGGSFGYLLGLNVIRSSKFPEQLKLLAINEYSEAIDNLIRGSIIEEYMDFNNMTMSLEQYLTIAELLRARLFEKSAKIGAILARGNIHYQIKPLSEAMLKIGQAFAIRDDILDVEKDILSKKKKFIYIVAVQNTDEDQSRRLNEIYRKQKITKNNMREVQNIFAQTNALVIAEHFSKNLVEQAKNSLKDIYPDLNREQKVFFNEFADFIYMRNI